MTDFGLRSELERQVALDLDMCIGCRRCLDACPVPSSKLVDILTLNEATRGDEPMDDEVRTFAYECIQDWACVSPCPAGSGRGRMMLYLKTHLEAHPNHRRFNRIRGTREMVGLSGRLRQKGAYLVRSSRLGRLRREVDKKELRQAPVLFYFGCYVFNPSACKALDIADRLHEDYEVLAGLGSCCGWPQMMQGQIDLAEEMYRDLSAKIARVEPKEVISGCAECFAAVRDIQRRSGAKWRAISTAEWLWSRRAKLPVPKEKLAVTFHDACHVSRKEKEGNFARELLEGRAEVREMDASGPDGLCCGYYSFDVNPSMSTELRGRRVEMARETGAQKMIAECISCVEKYEGPGREAALEVEDLVTFVHRQIFAGHAP